MNTLEDAREVILAQLTIDDSDVRADYLKLFNAEVETFSAVMAQAFMKWRSLDAQLHGEEKKAFVSATVFTAITLHVLSMKLFLSGITVAAGNISRQVVEAIALSIAFSGEGLNVLDRFMNGKYSGNHAVRDILRHAEKLGLNAAGVRALSETDKFYDKYSHVTVLTISTGMSFAEKGGLYMGPVFDPGKSEAYQKEMASRMGLAQIFPNIVDGIFAGIAKW